MSTVDVIIGPPPPEASERAARRAVPRKLIAGCGVIGFMVLVAIFAPLIAPHDPNAINVLARLQEPGGSSVLGTDALGRDLLSRIIWAARTDIPVAFLGVLLPLLLGVILGSLAGFVGGLADTVVMRTADVVQAFPVYILLIALVFALGPGVRSAIIAFVVIDWVAYARLVRGDTLRIRGLDYVSAARGAGLSRRRILTRHVLPNTIPQTAVYASSDAVLVMLSFAALSYFGLGAQPPTAEWGAMIQDGQLYLNSDPWLAILPGLALILTGTGFALIGDGLDDFLR